MGKFVLLLAAGLIAGMACTTVTANEEAEARIQACEQQNQNAPDRYATVSQCLDEQAQYDTSDSGE